MSTSSPSGLETSRSLLGRARSGESDAWERVVELYAPLVYSWCRRCDLQETDIADILQEVFQAVALHLDRFQHRGHSGAYRGWLRAITTNKIRDLFRARAREVPGAGGTVALNRLAAIADPASLAMGQDMAISEQAIVLRAALERIRPRFHEITWRAFWRTAVDGCPATEVADELSTSPGAVRVAKYRVLRRLRSELEFPA